MLSISSSGAREVRIFLGFILLTLLMTWPWTLNLRAGIPDPGDPYAHAYFLWWDYHQTFRDPLHLFEATMFYPYHETLAFSESDYGIALLFFPLFALGFRPLTVYILATLTGFAFTAYGAFRLARTLNLSKGAGLIAGIVFAFVPYRFNQLSHLPIIFTGWIPLLLEALVLFARERSWKRAAWLGFAFVMNALTCLTWFVLTSVPLLLSILFLMVHYGAWRERRFWLRGGLALCAALLVLFPFLLPYYHVSQAHGFIRSRAEVAEYSARLVNWLAVEERNKLWRGLGGAAIRNEMVLFPGLLPPLLMLISLLAALSLAVRTLVRSGPARALRALRAQIGSQTEAFTLGLIWAITGFLGSLGLNSFFHRALYEYVPLFRSMRVAARWSMLAYLGMALLAGLGAQALCALAQRRWSNYGAWAVYALLILSILFEQRVAPLHLIRGEVEPDELTLRLKETPMRGGLVELPAGPKRALYMLRAAEHEHPFVTAISSFVPPIEQEIETLTNSRPVPDHLLELLESIPVSYLTIHNASLNPESRAALEAFIARAIAADRLRFIRSFGAGRHRQDLYAVTKTEPEARSEAPSPPPLSVREINEGFLDLPAQFRETGFYVYRLYKASYGRMPAYAEFTPDARSLRERIKDDAGGPQELERAERDFADNWTSRAEFKERFDQLNNEEFLRSLYTNMGGAPEASVTERLLKELNAGRMTRASALHEAAGDEAFILREFNSAFVLMHYFAYLKRDPEVDGHKFWLSVINSGVEPDDIHREFVSSQESRIKAREP